MLQSNTSQSQNHAPQCCITACPRINTTVKTNTQSLQDHSHAINIFDILLSPVHSGCDESITSCAVRCRIGSGSAHLRHVPCTPCVLACQLALRTGYDPHRLSLHFPNSEPAISMTETPHGQSQNLEQGPHGTGSQQQGM